MTGVVEQRAAAAIVRVLLVEDSDGDARLVELMLADVFGTNIEVLRAHTLGDALAYLEGAVQDCVILDLGLADANGLEAMLAIRDRLPEMAVVVLTGQGDVEMGMRAVAIGAQDYLAKDSLVGETLGRSIRYAVARKRAADALRRSNQALADAQHVAHLGSWEVDLTDSRMAWSAELSRLYGALPRDEHDLGDLMIGVHPDDAAALQEQLSETIEGRADFDIDHRVVLADTTRWLRSQGQVERNSAGVAIRAHGTAQDITDRKMAEEALAHQALHDPLTGLPNRVLLLDRLGHALSRMARSPETLGLLFVDIDRFKVVNDSLGHVAGDHMLLAVTRRLLDTLRRSDTLARFGGDEFVVLCEAVTSAAEILGIAHRIGQAMEGPLSYGSGDLVVTVSIGVAITNSPFVLAESLLRDADAAMYRAKQNGRAQTVIFSDAMRAEANDRLETEVALRRSLAEGDFRVLYQPVVHLATGAVIGHEALVRWQHPERGLLTPDQFIPISEETGLITKLGAWVLAEACREAQRFQDRHPEAELTMAVNLSAYQIAQPELTANVRLALLASGLRPDRLILEITESSLMSNGVSVTTVLHDLKALGVQLAIDDFGTGYSSLSYLKQFPVDQLKIDRTFVSGLGRDPKDLAIVAAIVALAAGLQLEVVAEGVETELQQRELLGLGCAIGQGYHFGRPAFL
jgi:diguanylate cyclase (GGDEF)-like protein/PAS domain S-box-containing protein